MVDHVPDRFVRYGLKTTIDGRIAAAFENEMQKAGWEPRQIEAAFRWYQESGTQAGKDPKWAAATFAYAMERAGVSAEKINAAIQIREEVNKLGRMAFAWDDSAETTAGSSGYIGSGSEPAASLPAPTPAGLLTGPQGE